MNERQRGGGWLPGARPHWCDESGKSSIRGVFALVLIVGMVYFSMKFIPVRTAAYQFNDAIRDEVIYAGSRRTNDDQIMKDLLDRAVILGLPITREQIAIRRSGRKYIIIDASYTVTIELIGGYKYDWSFSPHHEGPVF